MYPYGYDDGYPPWAMKMCGSCGAGVRGGSCPHCGAGAEAEGPTYRLLCKNPRTVKVYPFGIETDDPAEAIRGLESAWEHMPGYIWTIVTRHPAPIDPPPISMPPISMPSMRRP